MKLFYRCSTSRPKKQPFSLFCHSNRILCRFNSSIPIPGAPIESIPAVKGVLSDLKRQVKQLAQQEQMLRHQYDDLTRHQQRLNELVQAPSTVEQDRAIKELYEIISVIKTNMDELKKGINLFPKSSPYDRITIRTTLSSPQFDAVFLRDCCACHRCVDPSTTQKLFDTADIPATIHGEIVEAYPDGSLRVKWANDIPGYEDHTSVYTADFLKQYHDLPSRLSASHNSMPRILWDRDIMTSNTLAVDYESYMNSACTLHTFLTHLHRFGLAFIRSVPSEVGSVSRIAERIGPLRLTFYGPTWDVKSVPSAKNAANTSRYLGFHQDLLYMADPPGIQMLHFVKTSPHGGESLFGDAFNTIERLRDYDDTSIRSLLRFGVTYQYKNDGQWYQYTRPTIEPDELSLTWFENVADIIIGTMTPGFKANIKAVNWSPPFQAPFMIDNGGDDFSKEGRSNLRSYLYAAHNFKRLAEEENAVFETKIEQGTCVMFDNRRILHARRAFKGHEVERWLRGAYVDTDPFRSRLRMLNEEYGVLE